MKKVTIGSKPTAKPATPDDWVSSSDLSKSESENAKTKQPDEKMKRLTIDVPLSLHQRVKSQCALHGENRATVIRMLLEEQFP